MIIKHVEIENFKAFQEKIHIDLGHPAVLIGPNNAGKTSVIQALSLWSRGIKAWFEKKTDAPGKDKTRISAGINRLTISEVPVAESRFFWSGTKVRRKHTPIEMTINVGIAHEGFTKNCRLIFTYRDSEVIYCKPCPETVKDDVILQAASRLQFHLLYPLSGILAGISADTEESPLPDGRIKVFLGQGQTAQVLRNLCYQVTIQDEADNSRDWDTITEIIKRLFVVKLNPPALNEARGTLVMTYHQPGVDNPLDIALAGRGLQQMLVILAYLYGHKNSILLVDEPDAHLEMLRQRQVYEILKFIAEQNGCQVVIATHSEVILDDAVDSHLTLLLNGEAMDLAKQQDMKNALRTFGIDHYYQAKVHPRILYLEGSSDIDMLRALAEKTAHPAFELLSGKLNCYYTQNIAAQDSLENRLDRASGYYSQNFKAHFYTLKRFVPQLQGLALFDSDGQAKTDELSEDFALSYWRNYELENYFISPEVLIRFVRAQFKDDAETSPVAVFKTVVDSCLVARVFGGNPALMAEFHAASPAMQRALLKNTKMSEFAEQVFKQFSLESKQSVLLNKGEFYRLIQYAELEDNQEIVEKLDMIVSYLSLE